MEAPTGQCEGFGSPEPPTMGGGMAPPVPKGQAVWLLGSGPPDRPGRSEREVGPALVMARSALPAGSVSDPAVWIAQPAQTGKTRSRRYDSFTSEILGGDGGQAVLLDELRQARALHPQKPCRARDVPFGLGKRPRDAIALDLALHVG